MSDLISNCRHPLTAASTYRRTRRPAISNHRLVSFAGGTVTFRWRDSAHHNEQKLLTLSPDKFLRRFLLHVLPKGFVRIRNFGFLANRRRATLLPLCFHLLGSAAHTEQDLSGGKRLKRSLALPRMWWTDAGHREAYCRRDPTSFSPWPGHCCRMKRLFTTRNFACVGTLNLFALAAVLSHHSPGAAGHRTFPQLNLHRARVRRNRGRLPSNGFIERAPEHRARAHS